MNVSFKSIKESVHNTAKDKGFWDSFDTIIDKMKDSKDIHEDSYFTIEEIQEVKDAFVAQKLMLMVSELGEALEAARKGRYAKFSEFSSEFFDKDTDPDNFEDLFEKFIKGSFEEELADTVIRIMDFCNKFGIDLETHILHKAKYNSTRKRLHGKKY